MIEHCMQTACKIETFCKTRGVNQHSIYEQYIAVHCILRKSTSNQRGKVPLTMRNSFFLNCAQL